LIDPKIPAANQSQALGFDKNRKLDDGMTKVIRPCVLAVLRASALFEARSFSKLSGCTDSFSQTNQQISRSVTEMVTALHSFSLPTQHQEFRYVTNLLTDTSSLIPRTQKITSAHFILQARFLHKPNNATNRARI
jgi:hypothetical protein